LAGDKNLEMSGLEHVGPTLWRIHEVGKGSWNKNEKLEFLKLESSK